MTGVVEEEQQRARELILAAVRFPIALSYLCYAVWGLSAFFNDVIPVHALLGREWGEVVWSAALALVSAGLAVAVLRQANRTAIPLTIAWLTAVSIYPLSLIWSLAIGELRSPHVIALALAYLVVPSFHLRSLIKSTRRKTPREIPSA